MALPDPKQLAVPTRTMLKEFKEFAIKGNMVDLAVGVIIGTAFGRIVESLVRDLIMPPLTLLTGGLQFTNKFLLLRPSPSGERVFETLEAAQKAGAVTLNFGNFLTLLINFLVIAWVIFAVVKALQRMKAREAHSPPPPAPPTKEELLLAEIRDLLKATSRSSPS